MHVPTQIPPLHHLPSTSPLNLKLLFICGDVKPPFNAASLAPVLISLSVTHAAFLSDDVKPRATACLPPIHPLLVNLNVSVGCEAIDELLIESDAATLPHHFLIIGRVSQEDLYVL